MKITKKYKVYREYILPEPCYGSIEIIIAICSTEKQAIEYCKQSCLYSWNEIDWIEE